MELPKINEGRHYHSSTNLNHKFVYVFGGIQNSNKKYSNTIERLRFEGSASPNWEMLNVRPDTAQILSNVTAR